MQKLENHVSTSLFGGLATLEIIKIIMHKFWYDDVKKNMEKKQNYVTCIQIAL